MKLDRRLDCDREFNKRRDVGSWVGDCLEGYTSTAAATALYLGSFSIWSDPRGGLLEE